MKKIKAWAVVSTHTRKEAYVPYKGNIVPGGWGSAQMWIFANRYEAKEAIECEGLEEKMDTPEIVECTITYKPSSEKKPKTS